MMPNRLEAGTGALSVRFWGTRGSLPVPGIDTVVYGGNTCCIEVRLGERLFMIDAGSGFEAAGRALSSGAPPCVDVLLSHLHHDHVSGFPFFSPTVTGLSHLRTFCGNLAGRSAKAPLDLMFSPPLFPVELNELKGGIEHVGFHAGETLRFENGIDIATCLLRHPGGATGYRFDHGGRRVCFLSDMAHLDDAPDAELVAFCDRADLVIYDTMFTEAEFLTRRSWGHSTWQAGVALCRAAGAHALAAFHHHKWHNDAALEAVEAELAAALPGSIVAREGQLIEFQPIPRGPLALRSRADDATPVRVRVS